MTERRSRTLSADELNAVAASSTDCFERVELDSDALPNTILQRLEESLRIAQKNRNSYSEGWITDISVMVGSAWGSVLVSALGWSWTFIEHDPDLLNGYAVLSPDEDYSIYPMSYVVECIYNDNADIAIELSFNMLSERAIPPGEPGSQSNLMPRIVHIVPP